jgi:hypothetical protein
MRTQKVRPIQAIWARISDWVIIRVDLSGKVINLSCAQILIA